jgi:hypothetical protein
MGQAREIAGGSAQLDRQVPAFYVSQITKPLEDRLEIGPTPRPVSAWNRIPTRQRRPDGGAAG